MDLTDSRVMDNPQVYREAIEQALEGLADTHSICDSCDYLNHELHIHSIHEQKGTQIQFLVRNMLTVTDKVSHICMECWGDFVKDNKTLLATAPLDKINRGLFHKSEAVRILFKQEVERREHGKEN